MSAEQLRFSQAEMAVVFQHLWGQPPTSETMMGDLKLNEDSLADGRRSLVDRGLLFADSRRSDSALSPALEPILAAVTRPQVLGVLQISRPGKEGWSAYFSWTPETIVFNQVAEAGDHLLEKLPGVEAIGKAALHLSGVNGFKKGRAGAAADPEAIVREASIRGIFMAVSDPAAVEPATEAISWLVSGGEIWLLAAGEGETPRLKPATAEEVGRQVDLLMNSAVERYREAQTSPRR